MTIEAMKQALEALDAYSWEQVNAARAALRAAIEQAEKPVECMCGICKLGKREWVGLTNKDIIEMWPETSTVGWEDIRLIEAKLKEKNHD
jgi:hypothetical protein